MNPQTYCVVPIVAPNLPSKIYAPAELQNVMKSYISFDMSAKKEKKKGSLNILHRRKSDNKVSTQDKMDMTKLCLVHFIFETLMSLFSPV